jgi:hypothetical protein
LHAAAVNVFMRGVAMLALRLFGQGLMVHTALTAVARGLDADRGKAIGIVLMGFAASEVVFLRIAVVGLLVGWRGTWLVASVALLHPRPAGAALATGDTAPDGRDSITVRRGRARLDARRGRPRPAPRSWPAVGTRSR